MTEALYRDGRMIVEDCRDLGPHNKFLSSSLYTNLVIGRVHDLDECVRVAKMLCRASGSMLRPPERVWIAKLFKKSWLGTIVVETDPGGIKNGFVMYIANERCIKR